MKQRTVHTGVAAVRDPRPPDLETMRAATAELLGPEASLPRYEDLQEMSARLRGHLMVLIPDVEDLAARRGRRDVLGQAALAGVGEARRRLDTPEGVGLVSAVKHAQRLARSVNALCDHYENLTGGDRP